MRKRKKQEDYFVREIAPYYNNIYQYLLRLGCEEHIAEDMAQETMEAAWKNIDKLMDIDYAPYWILDVAKNKYYSYLRLVFHKYELSDEQFDLSDLERSKVLKDISVLIVAQESHEIVDKALSQLGSKYSDLIRMKYFGGYTYREMSEKLGINESTIRSAVMRGIHKLDKILKDLGYTEEDM